MHLGILEEHGVRRVPIPCEGLAICRQANGELGLAGADHERPLALVIRFYENGAQRAALICSPLIRDLWIEGGRPVAGLCVLEDRAEIAVAGARLFFSAADSDEELRFPDGHAPARCARCTRPLLTGDQVLRCGRCRALQHEGELAGREGQKRLCASYDERCPSCGRVRGDRDDPWGEDDA